MPAAFRYKAFLSYSHSDQKEAAWLHAALEKYRLPKQLLKILRSENGATASDRLGRIFRDRDELPAADDLTAEVKKALQSSEFMIVLCSPRAAASRWVNKEVIEFKKLRGEAAVLPIILEGEPNASSGSDASLECFPPGVRFRLDADGSLSRKHAEPIAADIRKTKDGRQRALLKLIAGLLGVGLDRLVEREMQRKQRRVIAVTAASMLGTVVMGALTYQALTARLEAEQNRAQAENLVEFMLTDLKQKLEPVGRLDVLDAVGGKAVEYYDAQPLARMPDASLGRRSRAFHVLGEVQNRRGNLDGAQAMFDQASAATASLLERDPDNADRIFEHSQSVYWTGFQDWQRANYKDAQRNFEKYKELSQQLVAADPANLDWQVELAYAHSNLATLLLRQFGKPREALAGFLAAQDGFTAVSAARPEVLDYKLELADKYAWAADAYKQFGSVENVLKNRRKQQEILREVLMQDERHAYARQDLLISLMGEARILVMKGDQEAASSVLDQAAQIGAELTTSDPSNMHWLEIYGSVLYLRAEWALDAGDTDLAALRLREAAGAVAVITSSETPTMTQKVEFFFHAGALRARLAFLRGQAEALEALAHLDQLLDTLNDDREAVIATQGGKRAFMVLYQVKGDILQALGRAAQAKDTLRSAFQQLDLDYEHLDPELLMMSKQMASKVADLPLVKELTARLAERGL